MAFLDPVLNPILEPLLNISPFWAVVIISLVISLIMTLVYKLFTNQTEMKSMKDKQKDYQKQMKELRSNPEEMMKVQKEAMKLNMEYMKHSFKPTLITMLPILLIFGWMAGHLAYEPIYPGETYSITADFAEGVTGEAELIVDENTQILNADKQEINSGVTWNLQSKAGEHFHTVKFGDQEQTKSVLITKDLKYAEPVEIYDHSDIKDIKINYKELHPLGEFSIFGWQPGWLGIYIIISIVSSMLLRKAMKIY